MKSILLHINNLLAFIVGILGFSGCREQFIRPSEFSDEMVVKYGCPVAMFDISGRVTDEAEEAIEGIEVRVEALAGDDNWIPVAEPVASDAEGLYVVRDRAFPSDSLRVIASDIDGENNGAYQSDTVAIRPKYSSDDWDRGTVKSTVDFKLKKK